MRDYLGDGHRWTASPASEQFFASFGKLTLAQRDVSRLLGGGENAGREQRGDVRCPGAASPCGRTGTRDQTAYAFSTSSMARSASSHAVRIVCKAAPALGASFASARFSGSSNPCASA